ncbi:MAG: hypothetical protein RIS64_1738, partial [Bacteroidota bacterium]
LISYRFVSAFELFRDCSYIHADIKPDALFIDSVNSLCAIIDYDSGVVVLNPTDRPTTLGTEQDWLAPELFDQISLAKQQQLNTNKPITVSVDLFADMWSVAIGIHYILFTFHPLFFLTELTTRSTNQYLDNYKFPNIAKQFPFFEEEYEETYDDYHNYFNNGLPIVLKDKFAATINSGYRERTNRVSFTQWRLVIESILNKKVKILSFFPTHPSCERPIFEYHANRLWNPMY